MYRRPCYKASLVIPVAFVGVRSRGASGNWSQQRRLVTSAPLESFTPKCSISNRLTFEVETVVIRNLVVKSDVLYVKHTVVPLTMDVFQPALVLVEGPFKTLDSFTKFNSLCIFPKLLLI